MKTIFSATRKTDGIKGEVQIHPVSDGRGNPESYFMAVFVPEGKTMRDLGQEGGAEVLARREKEETLIELLKGAAKER